MTTFAVLGTGGWGTAVAVHLAQNPAHRVRLWGARSAHVERLRATRENERLLPGVCVPGAVAVTACEREATAGADYWIVAIPTAYLRETLKRFVPYRTADAPIVSLTKGLEVGTFARPSEIVGELFRTESVAVLSGPSHAEEVARGLPTSLVVAADGELAARVQRHFGTERFRVYTNTDVAGVELAGALKNVMGVAAGVCDGLGFGDNAKAALLTRGLVEMTRFGVAHGAEPATFSGLAGVGDLITTCFSPHGRNRRVGFRLGTGEPLADVLNGPQVAEGVWTAKSAHERAARTGIETPITEAVYRVLHEGLSPLSAMQRLMARAQKTERG